jgi:hypothetical protein
MPAQASELEALGSGYLGSKAPGPSLFAYLGAFDWLERTHRCAEERNGVHTETALQLLANPHGLASSEWGGALVDR